MDFCLGKYLIEHRLLFDSHLMTLSHGGCVSGLAANEAQLLLLLMDGTVKKQTVIAEVWESKGVYVTESSYHQLVRSLRLKLEAHGVAGSLIKTLPRFGLRFVGAVEHLPDETPPVRAGPATEPTASGPDAAQPVVARPAATVSTQDAPLPHEADERDSDAGAEGDIPVAHRNEQVTQLTAASAPGIKDEHTRTVAPAAPLEFDPRRLKPGTSEKPRPQVPRQARRFFSYKVVYLALSVWAAFLAWRTFFPKEEPFHFRYQQTIGGVHYFSTGKMEQRQLLKPLGIAPVPGSYIYQIDLGERDWLAICPRSIYEAPELCKTYFFEEVKTR
jgi:DNA-binding winged helix-turn-helix (wHTH) protein